MCEICGTTFRVGLMTFKGGLTVDVCVWCHEDENKIVGWLKQQIYTALEANPDYKRLSDDAVEHAATFGGRRK